MIQRKNFDRAFKLHAACAMREMRQELAYITFRDGYAYANNGAMVVKADLSRISTFNQGELAMMENRSIHMDSFRRLLNYQVANVTEQGFEVNDQGRRMLIYFNGQIDMELPGQVDSIFDKCTTKAIVGLHTTAVIASMMRIASAALGSDFMRIDFYDSGQGHLLTRISPLPLLGSAEAVVYQEIITTANKMKT